MTKIVKRPDSALWKPLGTLLVEKGLVKEDELDLALVEHERTGQPLGEVLIDLGVIKEAELTKVLLEQLGLDLSKESGFGSGLRDELHRRGSNGDSDSRGRTVIIRELPADDGDDAKAETDPRELRREVELERSDRRRFFGRRKDRQANEQKLSDVAAHFERQSAAIQKSLAEIRHLLDDLAPDARLTQSPDA